MKKSIAIFGANGFLGSHLCNTLKEEYNVISISRSGEADYLVDITKKEDFSCLKISPEIVINCATYLPGGDFWEESDLKSVFEVNFWGSYNIAKWIKENTSVNYVINISTLAVINKPWELNLKEDSQAYPFSSHQGYCISKLNQELIFNALSSSSNVKVCNARISALFGKEMKWNGVLPIFIDNLLNNKEIRVNNGNLVSADFLDVRNASKMIEALLPLEKEGIINIASGREVFLNELINLLVNIIPTTSSKIIENNNSNGKENRSLINVDKIKTLIDFSTLHPLEDSLKDIVNYRKLELFDK